MAPIDGGGTNITKHSMTFAQVATVLGDRLALTIHDAANRALEEHCINRVYRARATCSPSLIPTAAPYVYVSPLISISVFRESAEVRVNMPVGRSMRVLDRGVLIALLDRM